eukprot:1942-Hanusia_phi.AAC.3
MTEGGQVHPGELPHGADHGCALPLDLPVLLGPAGNNVERMTEPVDDEARVIDDTPHVVHGPEQRLVPVNEALVELALCLQVEECVLPFVVQIQHVAAVELEPRLVAHPVAGLLLPQGDEPPLAGLAQAVPHPPGVVPAVLDALEEAGQRDGDAAVEDVAGDPVLADGAEGLHLVVREVVLGREADEHLPAVFIGVRRPEPVAEEAALEQAEEAGAEVLVAEAVEGNPLQAVRSPRVGLPDLALYVPAHLMDKVAKVAEAL